MGLGSIFLTLSMALPNPTQHLFIFGHGLCWFRRPQGLHRGSHPVVGGNVHVSCRTVCGRWAIIPTVTAWAVSCFPYDMVGMASDRTEVTAVPSVLMRSVRRTCPYQTGHVWRDLVPYRHSWRSWWRGREPLPRCMTKAGGEVGAGYLHQNFRRRARGLEAFRIVSLRNRLRKDRY